MTYRCVLAHNHGSLDALEVVERPLPQPGPGEARLRTLAASISQDDVGNVVGNRPVLPQPPFITGYSVIGEVDAVGHDVGTVGVGDRVAALLGHGAHAEVLVVSAAELAPVPPDVDLVAAMPVVLNYLVAWQATHRVARPDRGDAALIIGASGGVGTALVDVLRHAGVVPYGLASQPKHEALRALGAIPIEYRTGQWVEAVRALEPDGLGFAFNGMDDRAFADGLAVLRRGGRLIHYGAPSTRGGLARLVLRLLAVNLTPNGKSIAGYGTHRVPHAERAEDWATLFGLVRAGELTPLIADTYPLLEAPKAMRRLAGGGVVGNLVLVA